MQYLSLGSGIVSRIDRPSASCAGDSSTSRNVVFLYCISACAALSVLLEHLGPRFPSSNLFNDFTPASARPFDWG